jgi:hypothetical protein
MGGDHQQPSAFLHQPFGPFGILVPEVITPVIRFHKSRGKQHINRQHCNMLEATSACLADPLLAFFRITCVKIIQSPLSAAMIMFPQQSTEKASEVQIGLDIKQVKKNYKNPQHKIAEPILEGIVFLLFLLLM